MAAVHSRTLLLLRSEDDFTVAIGSRAETRAHHEHWKICKCGLDREPALALHAMVSAPEWIFTADVASESDGHHARVCDEDPWLAPSPLSIGTRATGCAPALNLCWQQQRMRRSSSSTTHPTTHRSSRRSIFATVRTSCDTASLA